MKFSSLQMRFPAEKIAPGHEISFQETTYILGATMPQTLEHSALCIGTVVNGYTAQFELLHNSKHAGAAWFYFYGSFEGSFWAVLDELELSNGEEGGAA